MPPSPWRRGSRMGGTGAPKPMRLEPRHWLALVALSRLQEDRGDLAGALRSFEAALAIHPMMAGGRQQLQELRRKAEGDDT